MLGLMMAVASIASATIPVQVVEGNANKPIVANVVAWEEYFWSGFHSGSWTCFRAAGTLAQPPESDVVLPPVDASGAKKVGDNPRQTKSLAFARGYCATEPKSFAEFGHAVARGGLPMTIRMPTSKDPAEFRLLYLAEVAQMVATTCIELSDRSFVRGMLDAVVSEADSLPRNFHEQFLARRVHEAALNGANASWPPPSIYKPMITEHPGWSIAQLERNLDIGRSGSFKPPWCPDGNCAAGPAPRNTLIPSNPYDVNLRDEDGQTVLMKAAYDVDLPAVKAVLAHGADPRILDRPGGMGALDLVLLRAERDVGTAAPDGVELHLARVVDALVAAHSSLHPAHASLLAHPERWRLDERASAFWSSIAGKVGKLQVREVFQPSCSTSRLSEVRTLRLGERDRQ